MERSLSFGTGGRGGGGLVRESVAAYVAYTSLCESGGPNTGVARVEVKFDGGGGGGNAGTATTGAIASEYTAVGAAIAGVRAVVGPTYAGS